MRYTALVNLTDQHHPGAMPPAQAITALLTHVVKAAISAPACITVRVGEAEGAVAYAWVDIERLGDVVRKDMKGTN